MLPDFPKAKQKLHKLVMSRTKRRTKSQTGPFGEAPSKPLFEGDKLKIERSDGSVDISEIGRFEVELKISSKDVEKMRPDEMVKIFDDAAEKMGGQISKRFYKELEKITQESGNVVDGKGQPFSIDQYFDVLEKIEIEFRPDGEPEIPTVVAGPKLAEKIKQVLSEELKKSEIQNRFNRIIEKKRRDWLDRESSRKLVG